MRRMIIPLFPRSASKLFVVSVRLGRANLLNNYIKIDIDRTILFGEGPILFVASAHNSYLVCSLRVTYLVAMHIESFHSKISSVFASLLYLQPLSQFLS